MRIKFERHIELCKKINTCYNGHAYKSVLRITTFDGRTVLVDCIDAQEAEDLYNQAYMEGYIDVSNRFCSWY